MTDQTYQWTDATGEVQIGRRVKLLGVSSRVKCIEYDLNLRRYALMRRHYSNEIEVVDASKLRPYPSEPIPSPEPTR